jgi:uncharacterized protein (DUF433 family)
MLSLNPEQVPIRVNADGVALVGQSRVRLEVIIAAFHQGDSPEQIADSFDVLPLATVYGVLAYYLHHRQEVDDYLQHQSNIALALRQDLESKAPQMFTLRQQLLNRKKQPT